MNGLISIKKQPGVIASIITSIISKFLSASRIWAGVTCKHADEMTTCANI